MFDALKNFGAKLVGKEKPVVRSAEVVYLKYGFTETDKMVGDEERKMMWAQGEVEKSVRDYVMNHTRFELILKDIKERFVGREIGIRGVMGMLGEEPADVYFGDEVRRVYPLNKIIESGTEQVGVDKVLVSRVPNLAKLETDRMPEKVEYNLLLVLARTLGRSNKNRHLDDRLVPTILVYDISAGSSLRQKDSYEHFLPSDPIKRAEVIIGAYPIDVRNLLPPIEQ